MIANTIRTKRKVTAAITIPISHPISWRAKLNEVMIAKITAPTIVAMSLNGYRIRSSGVIA